MAATIRQKTFDPERQLFEFEIIGPTKEVIGMAQLRLKASRSPEMPKGFDSNIYYEIAETHRRQGYATDALRAILKESARHGLNSLTATVNSDNAASIKVLEKCGAKLEAKGKTSKGVEVLKYSFVI